MHMSLSTPSASQLSRASLFRVLLACNCCGEAVTIDVKFDRATLRGALPVDTNNDIVCSEHALHSSVGSLAAVSFLQNGLSMKW